MVRRSLWLFTAIASLAFMSAAARAATSPYDAIYVFGDSYCDVGNIYTATKGAIPHHLITMADSRTDRYGLIMSPALGACR